MKVEKTSARRLLVVLAASAALTAGCTAPVNADELPGTYRSDETGGQILLGSDGTFSATDIAENEVIPGGDADILDFHGTWDFVDSETASDFVYLAIEDDGLGLIGGVQLYTNGNESLEFRPDPDGPPSIELTKTEG